MSSIKLNVDVLGSVVDTFKQIDSMGKTVFGTVENVKKGLNDIKTPNVSNVTNIGDSLSKNISFIGLFFSSLVSNAGGAVNILESLKTGIEIIGGEGVKDIMEKKGLIAGIKSIYPSVVESITGIESFEVANMSFMESFKKVGIHILKSPFFLVPMAIMGIVLAIQEFGKYMGWWTDWGSMIESFSDGIKRLWDAFINNPQVIAFIKGLKEVWEDFVDFISPLTKKLEDWWNSIFPPQSGEFDIVRAIIDIFGELGEKIGGIISTVGPIVKGFFDGVVDFVKFMIENPIVPVIMGMALAFTFLDKVVGGVKTVADGFKTLKDTITGVPGKLGKIKTTVMDTLKTRVKNVKEAFNTLKDGIAKIPSKLSGIKTTVMDTLKGRADAVKGAFETIKTSAGNAIGNIKSVATSIAEGGKKAVTSAAGYVSSALGIGAQGTAATASTPGLWGMAAAGWAAIAPWLPFIAIAAAVVAALYLLITNWDSVSAAIMNFVNTVKSFLQPAIDTIKNILGTIGDIFGALFSGDFGKAGELVGKLGQQILEAIGQLWNFILDGIGNIGHKAIDFVGMIVGWILGDDAASKFTENASNMLNDILSFLGTLPTRILDLLSQAFQIAVDFGTLIWNALTGGDMSGPAKSLSENITKFLTSLGNLGIDFIGIFLKGIFGEDDGNNMIDSLKEWLDKLLNPETFGQAILEALNSVAEFLLSINPIKPIIDSIFGEGTFENLMNTVKEFLRPVATAVLEALIPLSQFLEAMGILPQGTTDALQGVIGAIDGSKERAAVAASEFSQGMLSAFQKNNQELSPQVKNQINMIQSEIAKGTPESAAKAAELAKQMKEGLKRENKLSPEMEAELDRVQNSVKNKKPGILNSLWDLGTSMVKKFRDSLDRHSPGIIARTMFAEMGDVLRSIDETIVPAEQLAFDLGNAIANGFGNPDLGLNSLYIGDSTLPTQNIGNPIDYSGAEDGFNAISELITRTTEGINNTLMNVGLTYDDLTLGIMEGAAGFEEGNLLISGSFYSLEESVTSALNNIADSNRGNWSDINNTTSNHLDSIYSATSNVTAQMNSAWSKMGNSLSSTASQIREQTYSKFNSLHKSISSFYNQLASARFTSGGLAAGPLPKGGLSSLLSAPIGKRKSSGGRLSNVVSTVKGVFTAGPSPSSAISSMFGNESFSRKVFSLLNMGRNNSKARIELEELLASKGVSPEDLVKYTFGGNASANVSRIYNTGRLWNIADPRFLGIRIPTNWQAKDFENGEPSLGDFDSLLSHILTARGFRNSGSYDFYFNSKKSNQQVWDSVKCNCYDGAEMLVEIASMFGKSANLVNGYWGSIPHTAARIGGKVYDMTQFQKRGVFRGTPGVKFGGVGNTGAGSNGIFDLIHNVLKNLFELFKPVISNVSLDTNSNRLFNTQTGVNISSGDVKVNFDSIAAHIHVNGVTQDLDEEKIARLSAQEIEKLLNNSLFVDKIVHAIQKRNQRLNRMGGG